MRHTQVVPYVLPSQTWVASATAQQTLKELPKTYLGRIAHLLKFCFRVVFTPTYSGAPDIPGQNNVLTQCDFWDGTMFRFQGGLNLLRVKERMHSGKIRVPDANTNIASTSARDFNRWLHCGPPQMAGSPSDYLIPTGMLETGELRFKFGALADFNGTVSAATATVRIIAMLALLDEVRIPPAYQYVSQSFTAADGQIPGQALYESIAMLNSASFDAITSGDFGNIRVDFGTGDIVPNVNSRDLTASMLDDFETGDTGIQGDPENATDVSTLNANHGTPTAWAAATADLQPVLWTPKDGRITKQFEAQSMGRVRWDGSQSTAILAIGRTLPQPKSVVATNVGRALARLGTEQKALKVKTISKQEYKGAYLPYMPYKVTI